MIDSSHIRNVSIIAHVDHGKTTIVDGLLKQSNTFRPNQAEMTRSLIMDTGDQEHERGITITAKQASVLHNGHRINIIDTPGHADFSGEVERTLNMADGVLLIVDAQEGPMPQTRFVLAKALGLGLQPVVVINKIDKPARRISEVRTEIEDLFLELAVHERQLHYPVYYAYGRGGKAWRELPATIDEEADFSPLFDAIVNEVPAPSSSPDMPLQLLVASLQYDPYLGKCVIGRINRGTLKERLPVTLVKQDGQRADAFIDKVYCYRGIKREEVMGAGPGDIVALSGISEARIGETIADRESPEALPGITIDPPTISAYFGPNTSPMKGREGQYNTSRQIGERLWRELEANVSLKVEEDGIGYTVSGRGELHLSVLIETLRREGYEFEVGRPQAVMIVEDGVVKEPVEELIIEVPQEYVGTVSQELGSRRATLARQDLTATGSARMTYIITTRALMGLRNQLMTGTRGTVIMNSLPHGYLPESGPPPRKRNGALVATGMGTTTPYALQMCEARGELYVGPGTEVYEGMIVGIHSRSNDLRVNPCKMKHLTNMRSVSSDGNVQLVPHTCLSLEQCLDFLEDDELLEVTPASLRLRKTVLDPSKAKWEANRIRNDTHPTP